MKDIMIEWVEENKAETDDGGWTPAPDYGGSYYPVFDTEEELDDFLWDYITSNAEILFPCPY